MVASGIALALLLPSLIAGLELLWTSAAAFGIAFWSALMFRRANRWGMGASLVVTLGLIIGLGPAGLDWALPTKIAIYLPAGFATLVIVSLLTPPEPEKATREFYALLATPVGQEASLTERGVEMVDAGDASAADTAGAISRGVPQGLLVVGALSLAERFSFARYRIDLLGFLAALALVVFILGLGLLVAALGRGG